jgi:hypothetical protein
MTIVVNVAAQDNQMMDISIPYYEDLSRISNSNIGWFLNKGPAYLHKMLTDPPPEEKNPVLERGTMIHEYLLQPEEFQKDYVVWNKSRPSSAQQEKFCQALASSVEIEPNKAVLSAYKEAYSTRGKSDDLMLSEGLKIASTLKDYIDFLKANDGRIMISHWDYQMLAKIQHNVTAHKLADNILYPKPASDNFVTYHEFHINWEYIFPYRDSAGLAHLGEVKCKSLLDGLTIDFVNKKFIIYDLKTTQKLWHFEDSINTYDYLRQLSFYTQAVEWYLENEYDIDPREDWTYEHYIIAIDTTGSYDIRVFKIDMDDIETRDATIHNAIVNIEWHQRTGKWDHSRAYYEGDGSEKLSL